AKLYYEANKQAQTFIENVISENNISCQYTTEDAFIYTNDDAYVTKLENEYKAYEKLNINGQLTTEVSLPYSVKKALKMKDQAYFHPTEYLQSLLNKCEENGVEIYEQTRALNVEYNKQPTIITEDDHRIICRYVIQASHYPFYDGTGFYPTR